MSTSPTPRTRGPVSLALRTIYLAVSLGVASFILSTIVKGKLALALDGFDGALGMVLGAAASLVGTALIAPAIAWAAGRILSAKPIVIGVGMTASVLTFEVAVLSISGTYEYVDGVALAIQLLVQLLIGSLLCTFAFKRGSAQAQAREEARTKELQASAALANMQFSPAEAPSAEAPKAAPIEVAGEISAADALANAAVSPPDAPAPVEAPIEPAPESAEPSRPAPSSDS